MHKFLVAFSLVLLPFGDVMADVALLPAVGEEAAPLEPLLTPEQQQQHLVFDISLHDAADLALLLHRLERLVMQPRAQGAMPQIALVLHGPEVEFFALKNYPKYQELVDLAAKLDAFKIIEVKACQTRMKSLGLMDEDMPAFIELVPFGPDEIQQLVEQNYLRM